MPTLRQVPHGVDVAYAAGGSINLELSPQPFTICGIVLNCLLDITTTTATNFSDYWERFLASLSLSGGGETYFDFTDLRTAYHNSRFHLKQFAPRRGTVAADSVTAQLRQYMHVIHFGVKPIQIDPIRGTPYWNKADLSAGIPPTGSGQLTLQGLFGGATAMGTNVTLNVSANCRLQVYLYGVQPDPGDPPEAYMPQAVPHWIMNSPTPTATSSPFATTYNIPAGDILYDATILLYNGTNDPRDDLVLTSIKLVNNLSNRDILRYGGFTDDVRHGKIAQMLSQLEYGGAPYSDDNSVQGTPSATSALLSMSDRGIVYLPIYQFTDVQGRPNWQPDNLYGLDLRGATSGDLQIQWGIADATGTTHRVLLRKYRPLKFAA